MGIESSTEFIEQLANALAVQLRRDPDELWSADDIATHCKMSVSQVQQRFCPLPSFPKAIRLPTKDGHRSHPRWEAKEVKAWFRTHKERA